MGEEVEEFHCTFGALGLFLIILTFGTGVLLSGRIGNAKPLHIHKYGTFLISQYFTGGVRIWIDEQKLGFYDKHS